MATFRTRITVALALTLALGACGEPSVTITAPEDPAYDGGHTFGGGNRSDTTTTTTTTPSSGEGVVVNSGGG